MVGGKHDLLSPVRCRKMVQFTAIQAVSEGLSLITLVFIETQMAHAHFVREQQVSPVS